MPDLEAPRAAAAAPDLGRATWPETADPYALVASLVTEAGSLGLSDQMWAAFALRLRAALPDRELRLASEITRDLRVKKDGAELAALRAVSAAADRAYVRSLGAHPVLEPGQFASWIAPPVRGINHQPIDFRYVRSNEA